MSAEILRRAAALMRERAEAAGTDWPWYDATDAAEALEPLADGYNNPGSDGAHIASWHPAVALTVADWLDQAAAAFDEIPLAGPEHESAFPAFAVARLYLREAADDRAA